MRTLTMNEIEEVGGGFLPLLAIAAAALLGGCTGTRVKAEYCETESDGSSACGSIEVSR
jgi:hypothetical protein